MRDDGTTLSDDIHELYVYKVWSLAVSHLNPHTPETTLTHGSQLRGFQWAGRRIQGGALVDDSRTAVGRLCLLTTVASFPQVMPVGRLCPTPNFTSKGSLLPTPLCHCGLGQYIQRPAI